MREILFRGKTLTGKWVEGVYYNQEEFYGTPEDAYIIIKSKEDISYDQALEYSVVMPESVGQYIGLCDRNIRKLFEGDIVEYKEEYGQITYSDTEAMFVVEFDTWCTDFDHIYGRDLEVVGNIIDNPELLYGGTE